MSHILPHLLLSVWSKGDASTVRVHLPSQIHISQLKVYIVKKHISTLLYVF